MNQFDSDSRGRLYKAALGEPSQSYYLEKFAEIDAKDADSLQIGWYWFAFLGGGTWALYRKMYKWFFIWFLVNAVFSILIRHIPFLAWPAYFVGLHFQLLQTRSITQKLKHEFLPLQMQTK